MRGIVAKRLRRQAMAAGPSKLMTRKRNMSGLANLFWTGQRRRYQELKSAWNKRRKRQ